MYRIRTPYTSQEKDPEIDIKRETREEAETNMLKMLNTHYGLARKKNKIGYISSTHLDADAWKMEYGRLKSVYGHVILYANHA